jgi:hypothetical protein
MGLIIVAYPEKNSEPPFSLFCFKNKRRFSVPEFEMSVIKNQD